MKAGLSLARPTKTTGTALLQKTVPHGARCPRIEPCPTQRADGRAAPPARRSGPERAAQARPSGSRPGTFGPLTHRCERKPIQRPIRKKQALAPAFTPALSGRQPAGDAFAGGETERGAVSGLFFAPFHTAFPSVRSDREARRESPRRTGSRNADKIQAIPEHTTARFRKSDVSSAHPLFGFRTDLRGGLFVFAPDAAFAASPHGPVGKPDVEGPAPPSYLRHRQGTHSVPPQQGYGKTGACPAADTAASAGPVSRFRIFPSRHARNVFRTAARRGAPHAGSLHLAGRLFRYRPSSPGPPRSSTKRYGKKCRPTPDPGRRKSHGQPTHRTGPLRTGADVFRHGEA